MDDFQPLNTTLAAAHVDPAGFIAELAGRMEIVSLTPRSCAERANDPAHNCAEWLFDGELSADPLPPASARSSSTPC